MKVIRPVRFDEVGKPDWTEAALTKGAEVLGRPIDSRELLMLRISGIDPRTDPNDAIREVLEDGKTKAETA